MFRIHTIPNTYNFATFKGKLANFIICLHSLEKKNSNFIAIF